MRKRRKFSFIENISIPVVIMIYCKISKFFFLFFFKNKSHFTNMWVVKISRGTESSSKRGETERESQRKIHTAFHDEIMDGDPEKSF